ncbi:acylphosphatase [Paracoccus aminophilus]|uniref:Acylphosphatase-like domain-containing protein n=1 Tax=Paracoccus aminophilus JCM 7686 TaxID=1367847 RepID=S5Y3G2_PARAH|nr:acylphosphatase [Paracoccus aminophilus]AGT10290.1 hypothetical protein JCM7686_3255 [Paracoccus aminophilus JCM 7686]
MAFLPDRGRLLRPDLISTMCWRKVDPWPHSREGPAVSTPAHFRSERFFILGEVQSEQFPPWIQRHADRLGLRCRIDRQDADKIELVLAGPEELLDAMEMACLLGPIQVWVDEIERRRLNN